MRTDYHASLQPQGVYHFYNKTVSQRKLFYDHKDYTRFLNKFKKYFTAYMDIVAYCLIPNHFHFMVKVKTISPTIRKLIAKEKTQAAFKFLSNEDTFNEFLSDQFRRFLSGHSLYINHKYDIQGSLLLKKTKRTAVVTDTKLYDLLCYIHHNPIHHGLTITYGDWPYSSFSDYLKESSLVTSHLIFENLGNGDIHLGKIEFIKLHQEYQANYSQK